MDMYVYFSTSPEGDVDFSPATSPDDFPSFVWKDLTYGDWSLDETKDLEINIPAVSERVALSLGGAGT